MKHSNDTIWNRNSDHSTITTVPPRSHGCAQWNERLEIVNYDPKCHNQSHKLYRRILYRSRGSPISTPVHRLFPNKMLSLMWPTSCFMTYLVIFMLTLRLCIQFRNYSLLPNFMFVCPCIVSIIVNDDQQDATILVYLFIPNQLYMFRAMSLPIIRRT